ncbi:ABC transporter permease [Neoactinobaculum massilliense]|uniref:ABC transporter permease n=1 Tax=Neoactinobaculum massilliense TaxID=2364794 RepID=UPI000F548516|nr:FtsX-like permease family protein [Neoactinobaculum massilliense]
MWKLAWAQVKATPRRYIALIITIVLGTAFLCAASVAATSARATLTKLYSASMTNADLALSTGDFEGQAPAFYGSDAAEKFSSELGLPGETPPLVGHVAGVTGVVPMVSAYAGIVHTPRIITTGSFTKDSDYASITPTPADPTHPIPDATLEDGRFPAQTGQEVALDTGTAKRYGFRLGDTITIRFSDTDTRDAKLVGLLAPTLANRLDGNVDVMASPSIVLHAVYMSTERFGYFPTGMENETDLPPEKELTATQWKQLIAGSSTNIAITTNSADAQENLSRYLTKHYPDMYVHPVDEFALAQATEQHADAQVGALLATFAVVALLVVALVIGNTFSVLVAQRSRQIALERLIGASKKQVRRSVLAEAAIIGLIGSVIGVVLILLVIWIAATIVSHRPGFSGITMSVSPWLTLGVITIGVLFTVVAAHATSRRATRIPPLAALNPVPEPTIRTMPGRIRLIIGAVLSLGGLSGAIGCAFTRYWGVTLALGCLSLIGLVLILPYFVPAMVGWFARLLSRHGVAERIAAQNVVRNRRRTASSATALLIGTMLVAAVLTGAATFRTYLGDAPSIASTSDVALTVPAKDVTAVAQKIREKAKDARENPNSTSAAPFALVDNVVEARPIGFYNSNDDDDANPWYINVYAVDPDQISAARLGLAPEDITALRQGKMLGSGYVMTWDPGEVVPVKLTHGAKTVSVDMVSQSGGFVSALISNDRAKELFGNLDAMPEIDENVGSEPPSPDTNASATPDADAPSYLWITMSPDATAADLPTTLTSLRDIAGIENKDVDSTGIGERMSALQVLAVVTIGVVALLGVSVLIALVGIANTLSLSALERTHENSVLRALGLTRRGLHASIAIEGVLIASVGALIGCIMGSLYVIIGIVAGDHYSGQSNPIPVTPSIPWWELLAVILVAMLAGYLASVLPSRRANKLPITEGLVAD